MLEICFWEPDSEGKIVRSNRIPDTVVGISRFQQVVLHQGRIEQWMTDSINKWSQGKIQVERPKLPVTLDIDESKVKDKDAYPVQVKVVTLTEQEANPDQFGSKIANGLFRQLGGEKDIADEESLKDHEVETINAKYVIGCDGAHSWVRKKLGIEMEGESTDYIWGVLDTVPITDFPDIRNRCAIHSKDSGSVMIIPREDGLVRLYIQLKETPRDPNTMAAADDNAEAAKKGRIDRSKITPEVILENARKIFYPYKLDIVDTKWYTAYQIGQRVTPKFGVHDRVFIAGDACHTHSPKAGQGMNTSMMDTYNLAWKISHVLKGLADPKILSTYESERKTVAQDLINFDHKLSRLFSGKPGEGGIDLKEFHAVFERGNEFASGAVIDYTPSCIVSKPETKLVAGLESETAGEDKSSGSMSFELHEKFCSPLAKNTPIGRRLDHAKVVTFSDAKPIWLNDRTLSDGRWRVLVFPGDIANDKTKFAFTKDFSDYLLDRAQSFVQKYTPATAQLYSVIDVILVLANKRVEIEWNDIPEAFRHRDEAGRMDYWSVYTDEPSYHQGHGKIYEKYGIDPKQGAVLVVRPDGYVSLVAETSMNGVKEIENFFDGFMVEQKPSWKSDGFIESEREEKMFETYGNNDIGFPTLAR